MLAYFVHFPFFFSFSFLMWPILVSLTWRFLYYRRLGCFCEYHARPPKSCPLSVSFPQRCSMTSCVGLRTREDPAGQRAVSCVASCLGSGCSTGLSFSQPSGAGFRATAPLGLCQPGGEAGATGRSSAVQKGSFHGDAGQSRKLAGPGSHVPWAFLWDTPGRT